MATERETGAAGRLVEELSQGLADVLESMTGERPQIAWKAGQDAVPEGLFWWEQPLTAGKETRLWVGTPEETWREIGSAVLHAAGIEECAAPDARTTYLEVLNQALASLAHNLGARIGREVNCEKGSENRPPNVPLFSMELAIRQASLPPVWIGLAPRLIHLLGEAERAPAVTTLAVSPPGDPGSPGVPYRAKQNPRTLDLLLEVELPVSVSFGRAQLPLKDVLKLSTGSIVELNRSVFDPVDVIVNNCLIARGEVVVIEGNYGVRIQEIISRQDRLRTLK